MSETKRVLILDQLNAFFRAYIVNPTLSSNGQPIGGLVGSLKILQKLVRESKPDQVVICWDGAGGSKKRKQVNKNYKAGRAPIRLNRSVRNLSEEEEAENKIWQQVRLMEYYNQTPFIQFMFDGVEADDVISYVAGCPEYKDWQKVIVSNDKDFIQLLDDSTVLHRPIKKETLNKHMVVEQFGLHPTNFTLARALAGDPSDNLPGIGGVGLKTAAKRFPMLSEEKTVTIDQLVGFSKDKIEEKSTAKVYSKVVSQVDLIKENYKIMQLYAPSISVQDKEKINYTFSTHEPSFNKTAILKMMNEDGFGYFDWSSLYMTCNNIVQSR
jgi:DNA polymerase-1